MKKVATVYVVFLFVVLGLFVLVGIVGGVSYSIDTWTNYVVQKRLATEREQAAARAQERAKVADEVREGLNKKAQEMLEGLSRSGEVYDPQLGQFKLTY